MSEFTTNQPPIDAVILPVAGVGSRSIDVTTHLRKHMVEVREQIPGNENARHRRPSVAYVLDEYAGQASNVIIVTTPTGEQQFRDKFMELPEDILAQLHGKDEIIEEEKNRREAYARLFNFNFIHQTPEDDYGTTVPLFLAMSQFALSGTIAYWGGDDTFWHQDGTSEMGLAIATRNETGADHVLTGKPEPPEEAHKYGVFDVDANGRVLRVREKPIDDLPETLLINTSRGIYDAELLWPFVEKEMSIQRKRPDEHLVTYVMQDLMDNHHVAIHRASGHYGDTGSLVKVEEMEAELARYPRHVEPVRLLAEI